MRRSYLFHLALAAGLLLATGGCSSTPPNRGEDIMEYLEVLADLEKRGPALEPGSVEEREAIERFQGLLADFKAPDFDERIAEVYAEEVFFNDTLKTLRGLAAVEEHLLASGEAVHVGTVEFLDVSSVEGNYYFRWKMDLEYKRIAKGELTHSIGMTHVRFDGDGRVVLHQDFWDSAGAFFEHVPVVGWTIRRVKKGL